MVTGITLTEALTRAGMTPQSGVLNGSSEVCCIRCDSWSSGYWLKIKRRQDGHIVGIPVLYAELTGEATPIEGCGQVEQLSFNDIASNQWMFTTVSKN